MLAKFSARRVAVIAVAVCATVLLFTAVEQHHESRPAGYIPAGNTNPAAPQWILPAGTAPTGRPAAAPSGPPDVHKPPRQISNGPYAAKLAELARPFLPAGAVPGNMVDYPDLHGATASFTTPAGDVISLTGQQAQQPLSLDAITTTATDRLMRSDTGSEYVEVRMRMPRVLQLILARPNGMRFTLTIASATPRAAISINDPQQVTALLTTARQALDTPSVDSLFS